MNGTRTSALGNDKLLFKSENAGVERLSDGASYSASPTLENKLEMINLLEFSWEGENRKRSWLAVGVSASSHLFSNSYSISNDAWSTTVANNRPASDATPSGLGDIIKTALFYIHFTVEY